MGSEKRTRAPAASPRPSSRPLLSGSRSSRKKRRPSPTTLRASTAKPRPAGSTPKPFERLSRCGGSNQRSGPRPRLCLRSICTRSACCPTATTPRRREKGDRPDDRSPSLACLVAARPQRDRGCVPRSPPGAARARPTPRKAVPASSGTSGPAFGESPFRLCQAGGRVHVG